MRPGFAVIDDAACRPVVEGVRWLAMRRYLVAFASVLVGVGFTVPYAVLQFRDLPPRPRPAANQPVQDVTFQELIVVVECCVVFYAITYYAGRKIYAALARQDNLAELQRFSGGHMALLHSLAGTFMVASPWLAGPVANPLATCVSVSIGVALLFSVLLHLVGWVRSEYVSSSVRASSVCPWCETVTTDLKRYEVVQWCFFFLAFVQIRPVIYAACPTCMRRILWRRCLVNVLPANLLWPFWVLPRTLIPVPRLLYPRPIAGWRGHGRAKPLISTDAIVAEVRQARETLAKRFNYDLRAMIEEREGTAGGRHTQDGILSRQARRQAANPPSAGSGGRTCRSPAGAAVLVCRRQMRRRRLGQHRLGGDGRRQLGQLLGNLDAVDRALRRGRIQSVIGAHRKGAPYGIECSRSVRQPGA